MTDPAAFQATIHGLRTVPSRGVVQVVVEAKIEELPSIARIAEHGAWVAVARLQEPKGGADEVANEPIPAHSPAPPATAGQACGRGEAFMG